MKILASDISKFINLVNLSGDIEIKECIARGNKTELSVKAVTTSKVVIVNAKMNGDFSELGDIGIDSLPMFRKITSTLNGEVSLTATANKLKISSGKKVKAELALRNPQYVLNEVGEDKLNALQTANTGNTFTLKKEVMAEFAKYYNVFGKELIISGDGNEVSFEVKNGDNSLNMTFDIAETVSKFEFKLASFVMKIFNELSAYDITISAKPGASAIVVEAQSNDAMKVQIQYIIAPLVK